MKYFLVLNNLISEVNYSARVKTDQSHDMQGFIKLMLSKRNLVSETDIVAVLNAFFEEVEKCVERGENINLRKIEASNTLPQLKNFKDFASASHNTKVTPGNLFELTGTRLKIDGDNKTGLWLVSNDNTELIATNTNKKIIGLIPQQPAGQYTIMLKTQYAGGGT